MQSKLGEKIKALRGRDGRKQEELAAAKSGDAENAMAYAEKALAHFEKWGKAKHGGEAPTSSPLVKNALPERLLTVVLTPEIFETWASSLPEGFAEKIRSDPRFAPGMGGKREPS